MPDPDFTGRREALVALAFLVGVPLIALLLTIGATIPVKAGWVLGCVGSFLGLCMAAGHDDARSFFARFNR